MDYKFLLKRFVSIILSPVKAWESISAEERPLSVTRNSYLLPLAAIVALAEIIGSFFLVNKQLTFVYSLLSGIEYFILIYGVVFSSAVILKEITYALDLGRDFSRAFRLVVYSMTPLFVCLVISNLFESLIFMDVLALYGLYIFWEGAKSLLRPPEHKKMPLLIATSVTIIALYVVFSLVLNQVVERLYYAFFA
jgi:hypothetical protein